MLWWTFGSLKSFPLLGPCFLWWSWQEAMEDRRKEPRSDLWGRASGALQLCKSTRNRLLHCLLHLLLETLLQPQQRVQLHTPFHTITPYQSYQFSISSFPYNLIIVFFFTDILTAVESWYFLLIQDLLLLILTLIKRHGDDSRLNNKLQGGQRLWPRLGEGITPPVVPKSCD